MNLALILLKTGQTLISETEQLEYEPSCHLISPYLVSDDGELTRWPLHTDDIHILLRADDLLTMCEPRESLEDDYLEKVGKTREDLTSPEIPDTVEENPEIFEDDEYEPRYVEE